MKAEETPDAFVTLSGSEADGWQWVIKCCPLCGGKHVHGAGLAAADTPRFLGHRVARCGKGPGGVYYLVKKLVR